MTIQEWATAEHVAGYLERGPDFPPHRSEGEEVLGHLLPERVERVLDLGTGDGRLLAFVLGRRPSVRSAVALDGSEPMLEAARARFAADPRVEVVRHDLADPLPAGPAPFDAVVSAFAIHHLEDERKRSLYGEVFDLLRPGGYFANLEHVASPSPDLHGAFFSAIGFDPAREDPSNRLASVEDQLEWLRRAGFAPVDCHWKWMELALLGAVRPGRTPGGVRP